MNCILTKLNTHASPSRCLSACRRLITGAKWCSERNSHQRTDISNKKTGLSKVKFGKPHSIENGAVKRDINNAIWTISPDRNPEIKAIGENHSGSDTILEADDLEKHINCEKNDNTSPTDEPQETLNGHIDKFCDQFRISKSRFVNFINKLPQERRVETMDHLSRVVDVLKEYGYGSGVKFFLNKYANKLRRTNIDHLRSILHKHHDPSLLKRKISTREILQQFPFRELLDESSNVFEFFVNYFGVDEKVFLACWHPVWVLQQKTNRTLYEERVKILEEAGVERTKILENPNVIMKCKTLQLVRAIEEQKNIFGEVNLDSLERYLFPSARSSGKLITLSYLFDCSFSHFSNEEKEFFKDKSRVNTAKVFYLMIDEGFRREEIRKFVFLLGFEETQIKQYFKDFREGDTNIKVTEIIERKLYTDEAKNLVSCLPDIGEDFKSKGICFHHKTDREVFLQRMQIALEFPK